MPERVLAVDWTTTLGPIETWAPSLHQSVETMLGAASPMMLAWGPDLVQLYNDAYISILGGKHPDALGRPARETWAEIWDFIEPLMSGVLRTGRPVWREDQLLEVNRAGYVEEAYFTFSYSAVRDGSGRVAGILANAFETTRKVIGERRLRTLRDLAAEVTRAAGVAQAFGLAASVLSRNASDVPFALVYVVRADGRTAHLAEAIGIDAGRPESPAEIVLEEGRGSWPIAEVVRTGRARVVTPQRPSLHAGPWPEAIRSVAVLPIVPPGQERAAAVIVVGASPRRELDEEYRGFFDLVAGQLATLVAGARALEQERIRAEALAELDRAKTTFFGDVSHEFRTPLTLLLGPLEELLREEPAALETAQRERLETAHRNALRLHRLVNTLLDFARIEAGRIEASYEPVDLAGLTADLASTFRSAMERGGLRYEIDCRPLDEPVWVDREMWEKIVFNLLSNALKFTREGKVEVAVRRSGEHVELTVRDTGPGIAPDELPRLFERFHRVRVAQARTQEGTGIGLALVQELVRLHGGSVRVESRPGEGAAFVVRVPTGCAHLPPERIGSAPGPDDPAARSAESFLGEALRWLPEDVPPPAAPAPPHRGAPRVLVADDNADMRDYLRGLLSPSFELRTAADGHEALEVVRDWRPDLVLSDVMMPGLDGLELVRRLRRQPETHTLPVVLLSARTGEEHRVEALRAGADDVLQKPFSARELVARIGARLEVHRIRQEAAETEARARRDAEDAREQIRRVLESITDGFVALDHEWRYVYVNRRAAEMVHRPPEELVGRRVQEVFPESVGTDVVENLGRAMRERKPVRFESYYPPLDVWFAMHAYPSADGGLALYVQDVTDRRETEETLRFQKLLLEAQSEASIDGILVVSPEGRIIYRNRRFLEMWGLPADLLREGASEEPALRHRERLVADPDDFRKRGDSLRANPARVERGPLRLRDGRVFEQFSAPVRDPDGRVHGRVTFVRDVTAQTQAEEEIRRAVRAREQLLAVVSHDLRNPLNAMTVVLDLLKRPGLSEDRRRDQLASLQRQIRRMNDLIRDLLDVAMIESGGLAIEPASEAVDPLVAEALVGFQSLAEEKSIRLRSEVESGLPKVRVDRRRVSQVFANLLANAIRLTPPAGEVVVRARRAGDQVRFEVEDTGPGIAPEEKTRIFDPLRRGRKTPGAGSGLGLAIARGLVEAHDGRLWLEDPPGPGCRFCFTIPVVRAAAQLPVTVGGAEA